MDINIGDKFVSTGNFVDGLLHHNFVDVTLNDNIYNHPKEVLQKMIAENSWHRHVDICDRCIDRLCELREFGEVTRICKFFLHQKSN
jgi:hypothetical protein